MGQDGGVDEDVPEEDDNEEEKADREVTPFRIDPYFLGSLTAFQDLQRTIAGFDFGFLPAIQDAARMVESFQDRNGLANIEAFQRSAGESFAKSVDFSEVSRLAAQAYDISSAAGTKELVEGIARSLDLPALEAARQAVINYQMPFLDESSRRAAQAIVDQFGDIVARVQLFDFDRFSEGLERWIPDNLRSLDDIDDLDHAARIALEEGIPLGWVPRREIVQELVGAPDAESRLSILSRRSADILDDCQAVLEEIPHRWAHEASECVRAYRSDFVGPAQSHAGNIVDSIVLRVFGQQGREFTKDRARDDFDDVTLRVIGEAIVVRPLLRAFTTWYPDGGIPPPEYFARHATAHAVGHEGLFSELNGLVAVMLATSMTVQFWEDPAAAVGLVDDEPESDD